MAMAWRRAPNMSQKSQHKQNSGEDDGSQSAYDVIAYSTKSTGTDVASSIYSGR